MKSALVTLLALYLLCGSADARGCVVLPNGSTCCGFRVGTFAVGITESFAQSLGYLAAEGLPVCYYVSFQSVTLYDTLLASGSIDVAEGNNDNVVFRRLNRGTNISVVSGIDGDRGFVLIGNTKVLNGWNSVAALQGQNIVVDSVDSGYVTGLRKVLYDYGVTNFTLIPFGSNRAGIVAAGQLNGVPIAATMNQATAYYLISYPTVQLAPLFEHLCPIQGNAYAALQSWLSNDTNLADLTSYFRALVKANLYITNPANKAAVEAWIATNANVTDAGIIELIYDDYVNNPASGLTPFLTPNKEGLINNIDARLQFGLSPYPIETVDGLVANQPGGFVDLRALQAAQASLGVVSNYDNNPNGLAGCPVYNHGTFVPQPPSFTCSVAYSISSQWQTGFTASLSVSVSNSSALLINGAPGWDITFTANAPAGQSAFQIYQSWNTEYTSTVSASGSQANYTLTSESYNTQNPTGLGWNANLTPPNTNTNICNLRINGVPCTPTTTSATLSC